MSRRVNKQVEDEMESEMRIMNIILPLLLASGCFFPYVGYTFFFILKDSLWGGEGGGGGLQGEVAGGAAGRTGLRWKVWLL